ncbi:hypothetical protein MVEN_02473000 [Mycena venus]|uniref:Uncharacterized protein n=1 Tax=Mycena venus TaxID=2733690 RepID=A0A8H6WX98_9AGAR|nr:hypothetical protein MVEN_02473000 [Mycena venus]
MRLDCGCAACLNNAATDNKSFSSFPSSFTFIPSPCSPHSFYTLLLFLSPFAVAHVAAWHKGMYCLNGTTPGFDDQNTNSIANPLFNLKKEDWWFHGIDHCDQFPPADGDFLELPANGEFTVELAVNRAFTTLSYDGINTGMFYSFWIDIESISLQESSLTARTTPMASEVWTASALLISIRRTSQWRLDPLSQYHIRHATTFCRKRISLFSQLFTTHPGNVLPPMRCQTFPPVLPAAASALGAGSPMAAANLTYTCKARLGFRCQVTGEPGKTALASAVPPTWCEDSPADCTTGARQMIYWNQAEGNNIDVSGNDSRGFPKSPAYNSVLGFDEGAQHDIFVATSGSSGVPNSAHTERLLPHWSAGLLSFSVVVALHRVMF